MLQILRNAIKCTHCDDEIESTDTYDMKWCKCGTVAVDGGHDYLKRAFKDRDNDFVELSEIEDDGYYLDSKYFRAAVDLINTYHDNNLPLPNIVIECFASNHTADGLGKAVKNHYDHVNKTDVALFTSDEFDFNEDEILKSMPCIVVCMDNTYFESDYLRPLDIKWEMHRDGRTPIY